MKPVLAVVHLSKFRDGEYFLAIEDTPNMVARHY